MKFLKLISVFSATVLCFLTETTATAGLSPESTFISIKGDNFLVKEAGQSDGSTLVNTFTTTVGYPCSSGSQTGVCVISEESCENQKGELFGYCYVAGKYEGICCLGLDPKNGTFSPPESPVADAPIQETNVTSTKEPITTTSFFTPAPLPTFPSKLTVPPIPATVPPFPAAPPKPTDPNLPTTFPTALPTIPSALPSVATTMPTLPSGLPSIPTTVPSWPIGVPPLNTQIPSAAPTLPPVPTALPGIPGSLPTISNGIPSFLPSSVPASLPSLPPFTIPKLPQAFPALPILGR